MAKEKYYTPDIEEFYVGFECEAYITTSRGVGDISSNWHKIVLGSTTTKYENLTLGELLHNQSLDVNKFRVKYLDKQDLIDEGLIDGEPWGMSCFMFQDMKNVLGKGKKPHIQGPQIVFHSWEFVEVYQKNSTLAFTIKNKSELKKLMKQIIWNT